MNAYANPIHEERERDIAREIWQNDHITTSANILREFREVERFGTAALNAYIQPLIHRYITRIKDDLKKVGVPRRLAIMQANGGIMSAEAAVEHSVNTVLSGPAAGVIAAAYISRLANYANVITSGLTASGSRPRSTTGTLSRPMLRSTGQRFSTKWIRRLSPSLTRSQK
jgi:N-methylhydantoinase A